MQSRKYRRNTVICILSWSESWKFLKKSYLDLPVIKITEKNHHGRGGELYTVVTYLVAAGLLSDSCSRKRSAVECLSWNCFSCNAQHVSWKTKSRVAFLRNLFDKHIKFIEEKIFHHINLTIGEAQYS